MTAGISTTCRRGASAIAYITVPATAGMRGRPERRRQSNSTDLQTGLNFRPLLGCFGLLFGAQLERVDRPEVSNFFASPVCCTRSFWESDNGSIPPGTTLL